MEVNMDPGKAFLCMSVSQYENLEFSQYKKRNIAVCSTTHGLRVHYPAKGQTER